MAIFTAVATDGTQIRYRDGKRHLYLLSLVFTLVPVMAVALYFSPLGIWACLVPALYIYGLVPVLDAVIGEDDHNPPEEVASAMAHDRYYTWLVRASVPLLWLSFLAATWLVGTQDLPLWAVLAFAFGVGSVDGGAILVGHELGHKADRTDQRFAIWALAVVGYAHFRVEHNRGHHIWVSTPEDPASARMGESVYRFVLREIPGAFVRGWREEAGRLAKAGESTWSAGNEILQGFAITFGAGALLVALFGLKVLPFIVLHHVFGWFMLTLANYVEHYGLLRGKKANGQYEACRPHHSWNTNHIYSNLMTFQLQRHSDHHAYPMRPYQALRDFPELPRLPSGYPGMFGLAMIPPLFFRVMDGRVMDWAKGDLARVNVHEPARRRLTARWGSSEAGASASA